MLKKTFLLIPLIISVFLLSGCNAVEKAGDLFDYLTTSHVSEYDKEYEEGVALCEEVIRCLDEDDKDTLKMMFSPHVREAENFDEEFNELFDFYEGKSVSHDDISLPTRGGSKKDGEWIQEGLDYTIDNLKCDNGDKYSLSILDCVTHTESNHIGLQIVNIIKNSNEHVSVGSSFWE